MDHTCLTCLIQTCVEFFFSKVQSNLFCHGHEVMVESRSDPSPNFVDGKVKILYPEADSIFVGGPQSPFSVRPLSTGG